MAYDNYPCSGRTFSAILDLVLGWSLGYLSWYSSLARHFRNRFLLSHFFYGCDWSISTKQSFSLVKYVTNIHPYIKYSGFHCDALMFCVQYPMIFTLPSERKTISRTVIGRKAMNSALSLVDSNNMNIVHLLLTSEHWHWHWAEMLRSVFYIKW